MRILPVMERIASKLGIVLAALAASPSWGAEPVGVLTLDAARSQALATHPTLVRLRTEVRAAELRADQIGTALNPTVGAEVGITYGAQPPAEFGDPDAVARAGVAASWTITDFGRAGAAERSALAQVAAGEASIDAVERDIVNAVDQAFWSALAQAELVAVAEATLAAETRHREEAERFVAAGTRAAIEVARAKTQEARAQAELARAKTAARQALVGLGQAMGLTTTPAGVVGGWSQASPSEEIEIGTLVERAFASREEVIAQRRRVQAAEEALSAADRGLLPYLTADASVGVGSFGLEEWDPSWQIGLTFSWPFYDGGATSLAAAAARADLEAAEVAQRELEVTIAAEVSSAAEAIASGKAELAAALALREAAEVELELAEQRWKGGLGSGIELADAQTRVAVAAADRTRAELTLALARSRLARAMGR